jgi:transcription factor S
MFCKKCGSILLPKKVGSKTVLGCSCGYEEKDTKSAKITEKKIEVKKEEERSFDVVEKQGENAPVTEADCPRCDNTEAYYGTKQTRAGDEGETKFLQCTKCKHKWREYG